MSLELPSVGREERAASPVRRAARITQAVITALAGTAGVLVLLAVLAPLAGLQLVRLATGSMSPGLPAGSVLLVQDTAADELAVGDIVTVLRADGSPVTHRVIELAPAGEGVRLTLKGDANAQVDPSPYLVTRAGRVLAGIPFGGGAFDLARQPLAIPLLSAGVSLLVLWAWWPVRRRPAHRAEAVGTTSGSHP